MTLIKKDFYSLCPRVFDVTTANKFISCAMKQGRTQIKLIVASELYSIVKDSLYDSEFDVYSSKSINNGRDILFTVEWQ